MNLSNHIFPSFARKSENITEFFLVFIKNLYFCNTFFQAVSWNSEYDIAFKGLAEGLHVYDFRIGEKFFEHFEESLVDKGDVNIKVNLEKRSSFLKLHIHISGWLELTCDRCLEAYQQPVGNEADLFVKFGDQEYEDGENVIWVLPEEYRINLAQIIYEYVSLSIPLRHVHPKNNKGIRACNPEMVKKLKEYTRNSMNAGDSPDDPRWNALKNFENNFKYDGF